MKGHRLFSSFIGLVMAVPLVIMACKEKTKTMVPEKKSNMPNIVLVMVDDLGWGDVGFNGNSIIQTPHLDKLAGLGVQLNRFYSASAVCSPTRASVMTGRNPLRMNIPGANSGHLPEEEITVAEMAKKMGYTTGHFGKWHLGILTKKEKDANRGGRPEHAEHFSIPTMHGYDTFFATESKVPTYDPMVKPVQFGEGESLRFGWKAVEARDTEPYGTAYWTGEEEKFQQESSGDDTALIMDKALGFMEKGVNKGTPFLVTLWPHTPHLPVVANSVQRSTYRELPLNEQLYNGTISSLDAQMGRLWKTLGTLGIQDNTLIWFCSDNGPENNTPGSAGPFRARKRSLYEGGVRVPAFAVWTSGFSKGLVSSYPMVTSDILPTLLEIWEINYPDTRPLDGISVLPSLEGKMQKSRQPIGFIYQKARSWVGPDYKLITTDGGQNYQWYHLQKDPGEQYDLSQKQPKRVRESITEINKWLASVDNSAQGMDYKH